jgi:hypothetical protein
MTLFSTDDDGRAKAQPRKESQPAPPSSEPFVPSCWHWAGPNHLGFCTS